MTARSMAPIVSVGLLLWVIQSPAAQQPVKPDAADLVGTWTLASAQRVGAGGEAVAIPNPRGLLIYDAAGHAVEIVTRGGRALYATNQPTPAEAQVTFANYGGFWGSYRADAQGRVTYRPEGAVNPNLMGKDLVRSYEFKNGRLTVTSLPGEPNTQGTTRWTWERVPPVENLSPTYRKVIGFWQHVVERRVNLTTGAQISENRRAPSVIVYSPSGYVGVHFVPVNRKPFAAEVPTDDEAKAAIAGYVGYFGALTVYPNMVFHHQLASLGPGNGNTLKRPFELVGSELRIKFPPNVNPQGQETTTLVTLKRLSGEADMLPQTRR